MKKIMLNCTELERNGNVIKEKVILPLEMGEFTKLYVVSGVSYGVLLGRHVICRTSSDGRPEWKYFL